MFVVFLMIEMMLLFVGVFNWFLFVVYNIGVCMWVMDLVVNIVVNLIGMLDYVFDVVCSIYGVKFVVLLYLGGVFVCLKSGIYQLVIVVGIDDISLFGCFCMLSGCIQDLYGDNVFIVIQDVEFGKLENLYIGMEFEVNDY